MGPRKRTSRVVDAPPVSDHIELRTAYRQQASASRECAKGVCVSLVDDRVTQIQVGAASHPDYFYWRTANMTSMVDLLWHNLFTMKSTFMQLRPDKNTNLLRPVLQGNAKLEYQFRPWSPSCAGTLEVFLLFFGGHPPTQYTDGASTIRADSTCRAN